ncbi:excinuclease ABC subunit UvrA [Loigolactobacillus backii]|uniref:excinuclease ABC subunit UvrA n=1 Tax=Loigolactobacillus backii TaxID=375175 RepID=UPI0022FD874A|nr:excinuclease ABC subunit UvrA [Loigolactobacillus backii]MDA5388864.1 excinuclease ABC subunit UvrA [Loigolactobacillus backii]MDA5391368.1 excinuclease ABC subunit UvrA [Loigolactobacillus backii]
MAKVTSIPKQIEVSGAHVNNLKNLSVSIPLNQFVAISGLSGSGKSSLAMGVLYAEGARRYLDSLSTYTRRRISQVGKADVDSVRHLPAALALRQRPNVPNLRSTVGTMTESFNILRLLFSRLGSHVSPNGQRVKPSLRVAEGLTLKAGDGTTFQPPGAESFAFNSTGACPTCHGTGQIRQIIAARLIPDDRLTIRQGAIASWKLPGRNFMQFVVQTIGVNIDTPFRDLSKKDQAIVLYGEKKKYAINIPTSTGKIFHMDNAQFENAFAAVEDSLATTHNERAIQRLNRFYDFTTCPTCHGNRFNPKLLQSQLAGKNIAEVCAIEIKDLPAFAATIVPQLPANMAKIGTNLVGEFKTSLAPLLDLGLDYLTLGRSGMTLSTGELQRIQLSRTLRSETTGVLYVLDEPSIGLHPANVTGLVKILRQLVAQGNSLIAVDHNTGLIGAADQIIEIGPGAGKKGGTILDQGSVAEIKKNPHSLIGPFLTGKTPLITRKQVPKEHIFDQGTIKLHVKRRFNLNNVTASFPVGQLTAVSGFSGAGKTTLILDSLLPAIQAQAQEQPLPQHVDQLESGGIKRAVMIDSTPVGKNVRSTVATYSGVFDKIRQAFAATTTAKQQHFGAAHFSYNTLTGACPTCHGTGQISLDVQYLPDIVETCPTCKGSRYNPETLTVKWHDMTIADVLTLSVDEAIPKLKTLTSVVSRLKSLQDMGLGYLKLGEATPTLSGGEAQRLKLVSSMGQKQMGTLFVFDEPSVGLHPLDIRTLIHVFDQLLATGATIITIEHDLDIIANADYVVDVGPRGGTAGGKIVATGTPREVANQKNSITGQYLAKHLKQFGVD